MPTTPFNNISEKLLKSAPISTCHTLSSFAWSFSLSCRVCNEFVDRVRHFDSICEFESVASNALWLKSYSHKIRHFRVLHFSPIDVSWSVTIWSYAFTGHAPSTCLGTRLFFANFTDRRPLLHRQVPAVNHDDSNRSPWRRRRLEHPRRPMQGAVDGRTLPTIVDIYKHLVEPTFFLQALLHRIVPLLQCSPHKTSVY